VRHLPKYYIDKYTTKKDGTYEVTEDLKKMVEFLPLNLNNIDLWIKKRGFTFDVIFCRNVLMYFSSNRAKAVIEGFYKILKNDGVLLVATTESVTRHSNLFKMKKVNNSFVYEKV
jgi:chemotaxis protein methyltransferase CheR